MAFVKNPYLALRSAFDFTTYLVELLPVIGVSKKKHLSSIETPCSSVFTLFQTRLNHKGDPQRIIMAWFFQLLLAASLVISRTVALQVTPNSQCASLCIDDATQDKSDPNVSNTKGSDIICHDTNYATALGQKFQKCVDCLQNSSDKSETESDLQWYLC